MLKLPHVPTIFVKLGIKVKKNDDIYSLQQMFSDLEQSEDYN